MPARKPRNSAPRAGRTSTQSTVSAETNGIEAMLLAARARGETGLETGRFLATYKEGALSAGIKALKSRSFRTADARDFTNQDINVADVGDADALVFPDIGVALISGPAIAERGMSVNAELASDDPMQVIEPEYFVFAYDGVGDYLRGFLSAATRLPETSVVQTRARTQTKPSGRSVSRGGSRRAVTLSDKEERYERHTRMDRDHLQRATRSARHEGVASR